MKNFVKYHFPVTENFSKEDLVQLGAYVADLLLNEERFMYCPSCLNLEFKKNGNVKGVPRGICLNCGKSFHYGQPELMYRSRLPKELWHDFIVDFFSLSYFDKLPFPKYECINKNTATRMLKRLKIYIYDIAEDINDEMDEIIKNFSDENYKRIINNRNY